MTDLAKRCRDAGVRTHYTDGDGIDRRPSDAALAALCERLGPRQQGGPAALIVAADKASSRAVTAREATLTMEGGEAQSVAIKDGLLHLPALPVGYHGLELDGHTRTILATPARCYMPAPWPRGKAWGLQTQLFGLRGEDDGGIGTFADLATLGLAAEAAGASFIGINPLHTLFADEPDRRSPYSPSSRLFLNPVYLAVDGMPAPETVDLVDYPAVWASKEPLLKAAYRAFEGDAAFDDWRAAQGTPLRDHCVFEVLRERHHDAAWWGEWPAALRDPRSVETERFADVHSDAVTYHAWLQWRCAVQLAEASNAAPGFGLYRDLAVGADQGGSEFWANQTVFAGGLDVGAPPDGFSPKGQNWGLPPLRPAALDGPEGLSHFRALVAANMRDCGLLRIDHAFQLERLYLVPHGFDNADGSYVDYPLDLLLAILKIESHRNRCVVVAEDLGTPPEGFRDRITEAGLLTYKVFYFERNGADFTDPSVFERTSFASISTHDLPTLQGWWRGRDIEWREAASQVDADSTAAMLRGRHTDRANLARQLGVTETDDAPVDAILARMAGANSMLLGVQLEDVAGEIEQANLPGTLDEHPNWRRRSSLTLDELTPKLAAVGALMKRCERDGQASMPARATYRLQFHADFTFADAEAVIPYLADLGISHVYASPIFEAEPGSTHGYDGTDPTRVSEALGGEEGLERLVAALRARGMGLLLDIVPNHLGIASEANAWWRSVLKHGRASPYADVFDIAWPRHGRARGKVALPVLGRSYGDALLDGELTLRLADDGDVLLTYYDATYPLDPRTLPRLLQGTPDLALELQSRPGDEAAARELLARHPSLVRAELERINASHRLGEDGELHRVIGAQNYRLMHWRSGTDALTHRRFFDINTLAGLRVEDETVFETVHEGVFRLHEAGLIDGVRIDHVDGLARPTEYLKRLRQRLGADALIYVEKILEHDEALAAEWPIDGTSGYDGLNAINGVFVRQDARAVFDQIAAEPIPFGERLRDAKLHMIETSFRGELSALSSVIAGRARRDLRTRDITRPQIDRMLREVLAAMPVYRTYLETATFEARDIAVLDEAFAAAADRTRGLEHVAALVRTALTDASGDGWEETVRRFQQLSGPVMAKGLEDTLFYRDARLISLNEVGGAPQTFGHTADHLHDFATASARDWPLTMVATATHDTKRGEDARARITALTHHADLWQGAVEELEVRHGTRPLLRADRLTFYQAALGVRDGTDTRARLQAYATKALREAKRRTTWTEPDEAYEREAHALVDALSRPGGEDGRLFDRLSEATAPTARAISLNQTILKHTLPGVPDTYQGTERPDYSLVDPDNRRPADYDALRSEADGSADDPLCKRRLTANLLELARALGPLFTIGSYEPLDIDDGVGFRRRHDMWVCEVRVATRFDADGRPLMAQGDGEDVLGAPAASLTLNEAATRAWRARGSRDDNRTELS